MSGFSAIVEDQLLNLTLVNKQVELTWRLPAEKVWHVQSYLKAFGHAADPLGPHLGPYGPHMAFLGQIRVNWVWTILKMLMVDFCSISTKFQPEWSIPGPFQTIFGFLGFFEFDFWVYLDMFVDKYMSQP